MILDFLVTDTRSVIVVTLFVLAFPLLAIYCIVDIVRAKFEDNTIRLMWVLIVLFAPLLGSIAYLAIGRKSKL